MLRFIRAVNLIDSADRCPGGMACSSRQSNLVPNPLPPETIVIVIVIDLPSLSSCEQLGGFSAPEPEPEPDPKTPTPKRRPQNADPRTPTPERRPQNAHAVRSFVLRGAGWMAIHRIELLSMPKLLLCCCGCCHPPPCQ